ncbi:hypothetical protein AgCh_003123 [Apium graveolens]
MAAPHGIKLSLLYLKTTSWKANSSSDCCSWDGVECDDASGYVIGLDLSLVVLNVSGNQKLSGYLPEFNKTSSFRELDISLTSFSGDLSWLHKLTKLSVLNLRDTNLHGDIPTSLANLSQLIELTLSTIPFNKLSKFSWLGKLGNYFVGEIPSWLMNMTQLIKLDLGSNELTVEVDLFLSSRNLTFLDVSRCNIKLFVPHHINFSLPKLEYLDFSYCNLTEFPYFLQFQSELRFLELDGNNIHGNIPHWIWNASTKLEVISLYGNYLTAIEQNPVSIQSKSLRFIDISNNMLLGNLPVPPPNSILYLAYNNRLTGDISPMICGVMSLKVLDLSNNRMSGQIPQCLANSLEAFVHQDNNFSGTIPQIYPNECELRVMDLSENQLIGEVPESLSNCKMLQILNLSNNQMKQTFPTWLGTLQRLQVLLLHSNMFHGAVGSPRLPSEFPLLCIINLSYNFFTGALPVDYIDIWNAMKVFRTDMEPYIETNMSFESVISDYPIKYDFPYYSSIVLTNKGQIPESLGSLEALQLLGLSNNYLTGPIPLSLGNLIQLESLDLSQNKLLGVIPQQLAAQLNFLAFFNVSNNFLSGDIPQGPQFKTFDNSSYMENTGLRGFPLSNNCGPVQSPPDESEKDSDGDKFPSGFDWFFILAGVGSGLVVGFVSGNILMDRYYWLIDEFVQNFVRTQKNRRRLKRQNIRN